jgi:hypothetical protein
VCIAALALLPVLAFTQSHPDSLAEWQKAGIAQAEADLWIAAGIPFAQWARQWKDERFRPAEARVWAEMRINVYTARDFRDAGFGAASATEWIAAGVRSARRALAFRDGGFGPPEAAEWWRLGFYPEDAAVWKQAGFTAIDALAWQYGEKEYHYRGHWRGSSRATFPVEWAVQWRQAGFTLQEARQAASYNVALAEANEWSKTGFAFDEAMFWRDLGFNPAGAARERAAGRTAIEAEARVREISDPSSDEVRSLHTDVTLLPDTTVNVTETIELVNREGGEVLGSFARQFPATVVLQRGEFSSQPERPLYRINPVHHDGQAAQYRIQRDRAGDITLCIGPDDVPISDGTHHFAITYTTGDRLSAYRDHDRLSFTVKPASLTLRVERATATVRLPRGANTVKADGLAGPPGRKYFTATVDETADGDVIRYVATRPLAGGMTFDAIVSLPKGVAIPTVWQRIGHFDRTQGHLLQSLGVFLTGTVLSLVYFVVIWRRFGKDPDERVVMTVYDPPGGLSPAAMRHLMTRRTADGRTVVATLVRLAQAGALVIRERDGRYSLSKRGIVSEDEPLHESQFFNHIFAGRDTLVLGTAEARGRLMGARGILARALRSEHAKYVVSNRRRFWRGATISIGSAVLALAIGVPQNDIGYAYLSFMAAVVVVTNAVFWVLLKAPTADAQKLRAEIRGFRAFLDASYRNGVAAHLPYAIALGVDHERVSILDREIDWYAGTSGGFSAGDFAASLNRLMPHAVGA